MRVVIIDYGSGNLRSVAKALAYVAGDADMVEVSSDATALTEATHIVLPGVGAFADCMRGLSSLSGVLEALQSQIVINKKPFLGICVGMQMLFDMSHEHGSHQGLGWIKGEVVPIESPDLKVPHMGWNELEIVQNNHPLLKGISTGEHAYFVHSYYGHCIDEANLLASSMYGQRVAAVVGQDNIMGTQFHPEKSQETGLCLLKNFLEF